MSITSLHRLHEHVSHFKADAISYIEFVKKTSICSVTVTGMECLEGDLSEMGKPKFCSHITGNESVDFIAKAVKMVFIWKSKD